jgi:dipicolinate synthase subunit B
LLLDNKKIGFALTGSFCTFEKVLPQIEKLIREGADILPIISEKGASFDTRFGEAKSFIRQLEELTNKKVMQSILEAESVGPKNLVDLMAVAPCTGNSLAKLANGITDGVVTMACKSHLRNQKPVVLAISTNDGLGLNAKNIAVLYNTKHVYLVPYGQDNAMGKPNSLVADFDQLLPTIVEALNHKQIQPVLLK